MINISVFVILGEGGGGNLYVVLTKIDAATNNTTSPVLL